MILMPNTAQEPPRVTPFSLLAARYFFTAVVCGILVVVVSGCQMPEGTIIYSPGDPNAIISGGGSGTQWVGPDDHQIPLPAKK